MIIMIITTMKRNADDDNGNNGDVDASSRRGATTKSVVAHKEKPPQALGKIATHQEAAKVLEKTNIKNICINYKAQTCSFTPNMQNNIMQIYLTQINLRASSLNTVRIFERCKHVFGGLSNACEIEGEAECDFESRSQGDDPASYPKWAPQMQFRNPQISIPKSTNHFVISAQESRSQGEELVALPSRIHQDPSPAQTGTDQLRTEY